MCAAAQWNDEEAQQARSNHASQSESACRTCAFACAMLNRLHRRHRGTSLASLTLCLDVQTTGLCKQERVQRQLSCHAILQMLRSGASGELCILSSFETLVCAANWQHRCQAFKRAYAALHRSDLMTAAVLQPANKQRLLPRISRQ